MRTARTELSFGQADCGAGYDAAAESCTTPVMEPIRFAKQGQSGQKQTCQRTRVRKSELNIVSIGYHKIKRNPMLVLVFIDIYEIWNDIVLYSEMLSQNPSR